MPPTCLRPKIGFWCSNESNHENARISPPLAQLSLLLTACSKSTPLPGGYLPQAGSLRQGDSCRHGAPRTVVVRWTLDTLCVERTTTHVCMKSQPLSFFPRQIVLSGSSSWATVTGTGLVSASVPSGHATCHDKR